jgi:DNA helicase-2/ATP-dependent DNA helicase PcrA
VKEAGKGYHDDYSCSQRTEFKHVYIAGMEDTLFPSPLSVGNPRELEEERRLFYVAVTVPVR